MARVARLSLVAGEEPAVKQQIVCTKCGELLAPYQIETAWADAGYMFDEEAQAAMTFACSGYSDERGCEGNDVEETACWWGPGMGDNDD